MSDSTMSVEMSVDELLSLSQVLVVTGDPSKGNLETQLWMGPKEDIVSRLKLSPEEQHTIPSPGLELAKGFAAGPDPENTSARYAAQLMLKSRKLSQMWTMSWLEGPYLLEAREQGYLSQEQVDGIDEKRNSIIRMLFLTCMEEPDRYWVNIPDVFTIGKMLDQDTPERMIYEGPCEDKMKASNKLSGLAVLLQSHDPKYAPLKGILSRVIFPMYPAWNLIRLSLLISGQVFWMKEDKSYVRLVPPILSAYDICVNYAFSDINWSDEFGCVLTEAPQPGVKFKKPGYYKTTAIYPPRPLPSDPTTTPERVWKWATAKDEYSQDSLFPFYPPKKGDEYVSTYVDYISAPYPYLPNSSS
ncbi:MAG: hypothetical protein AB4426_26610 [Xenococcaceae cyanobacterium]